MAVLDDAVGEQDVRYIVVRLSTNTTNAQTVSAVADEIVHGDITSGSHCDTIVLIDDSGILDDDVGGTRDVEAVRVVRSWETVRSGVGSVASGIVEGETSDRGAGSGGDFETVDGPVLDVEILDDAGTGRLKNNEVIGSRQTHP